MTSQNIRDIFGGNRALQIHRLRPYLYEMTDDELKTLQEVEYAKAFMDIFGDDSDKIEATDECNEFADLMIGKYKVKEDEMCEWENLGLLWRSSCGRTPEMRNEAYSYCPYCGKKIDRQFPSRMI